ncbi:hypothetical protein T484DRAFT_3157048 [Baffinella frigidus]|nr:hypothetical protein T484DRAFT_3157048 [Cryptophyta sp. CCMP2293]
MCLCHCVAIVLMCAVRVDNAERQLCMVMRTWRAAVASAPRTHERATCVQMLFVQAPFRVFNGNQLAGADTCNPLPSFIPTYSTASMESDPACKVPARAHFASAAPPRRLGR